jgi:hypothetical protein
MEWKDTKTTSKNKWAWLELEENRLIFDCISIHILQLVPILVQALASFKKVSKIGMLKGQCHLRVCQVRSLVNSSGLNNVPRICFTLLKSHVKSLRLCKQGDSRSKMAGAGFHSFANFRALISWIATTIITPWQTAFQGTADCHIPLSGLKRTMHSESSGMWQSALKFRFPDCKAQNEYFQCGNPRSTHCDLPTQG